MRPEQSKNLDDLLGLARRAEPPALDELELRRLARAALTRADLTRAEQPAAGQPVAVSANGKVGVRRWMGALWPLVAAALVLGWYTQHTRYQGTLIEVGRADLALRLALRPGDVVIAAPGTALRIAAQKTTERRIEVERGTALFDVVPLAPGQSFEVQTEHARLRVLGTVFSVEVAGRTVVRVYEGRVFLAGRTLHAGDVWVSAGVLPSPGRLPALAHEAAQHAALRSELARGTLPSVVPQPLAIALPQPLRLPARDASTVARDASTVARDAPAAARVYAEATRRLYSLGDAVGALGLLDAYDLDAEHALLRERASVLRVDALLKLGRLAQAAEVARRYVLREPETHTSVRMRALAAGLVAPLTARE